MIHDLLYKVQDLVNEINAYNNIIKNHTDQSVISHYKKQREFKVTEYIDTCKKLKILLEEHFQKEKENNLPIKFAYRFVYKKIKEVLSG